MERVDNLLIQYHKAILIGFVVGLLVGGVVASTDPQLLLGELQLAWSEQQHEEMSAAEVKGLLEKSYKSSVFPMTDQMEDVYRADDGTLNIVYAQAQNDDRSSYKVYQVPYTPIAESAIESADGMSIVYLVNKWQLIALMRGLESNIIQEINLPAVTFSDPGLSFERNTMAVPSFTGVTEPEFVNIHFTRLDDDPQWYGKVKLEV